MDREEALEQFRNVLGVINDCLEQAEELCLCIDHGYVVDIQANAQEDELVAGAGKKWVAPIKLIVHSK